MSKEFKGTKGEWRISVKRDNETNISTSNYRICEVKHYCDQIDEILKEPTIEEGAANAKLIADSPLMLGYIIRQADKGCDEAKKIISKHVG